MFFWKEKSKHTIVFISNFIIHKSQSKKKSELNEASKMYLTEYLESHRM